MLENTDAITLFSFRAQLRVTSLGSIPYFL